VAPQTVVRGRWGSGAADIGARGILRVIERAIDRVVVDRHGERLLTRNL